MPYKRSFGSGEARNNKALKFHQLEQLITLNGVISIMVKLADLLYVE
jgi:hypothetical protein